MAALTKRGIPEDPTSLSWGCSFRDANKLISIPIDPKNTPLSKGAVLFGTFIAAAQNLFVLMPLGDSFMRRSCTEIEPTQWISGSLPSFMDVNACRVIGELVNERSKEANMFGIAYEARKDERTEGKLGIVLDTITEKASSST